MKTLIYAVMLTTGLLVSWQATVGDETEPLEVSERSVSDVRSSNEPLIFVPKAYDGVFQGDTRLITNHRRSDLVRSPDLGTPPRPMLLVPRQAALTTQSQPSLFWYLSRPVDHEIKLAINLPSLTEPIFEMSYNGNEIQGIQRIDLATANVTLHPGMAYELVVKMVLDPQAPANDVYTKTVIQRIAGRELTEKWAGASLRQRASIAADEGIWIDAIEWISDLIEDQPDQRSLRRDRADLLRFAGFHVVLGSRREHDTIAMLD